MLLLLLILLLLPARLEVEQVYYVIVFLCLSLCPNVRNITHERVDGCRLKLGRHRQRVTV